MTMSFWCSHAISASAGNTEIYMKQAANHTAPHEKECINNSLNCFSLCDYDCLDTRLVISSVFDFSLLPLYSVVLQLLSSSCMWWTHVWKKKISRLSRSLSRCPSVCCPPTLLWASSHLAAWFKFTSWAARGLLRAMCSEAPRTLPPNRYR